MTTPAPTAAAGQAPQGVERFQQWNKQDWWDPTRWTLTGGIADSDFKAGLWWQDSIDMNNNLPAIHQAAQQWQQVQQQFQNMRDGIRTARSRLVGERGADAEAQSAALDKLDNSLVHQMDQMAPVPNALTNLAGIVQQGHGQMQTLWDKWDNDRAAAPVCHEDVVQMQPVIGQMAQAHLDTADAIQKAWSTELEAPGPGASTVSGGAAGGPGVAKSTAALGSEASTGNADAIDTTENKADIDGSEIKAASGNTAGTVVGGTDTGTSAAGAGAGAGTGSTFATPGTVVAPSSGGNGSDNGVTLAGAGAGTLAPPPSLSSPGFSSGLGTAGIPSAPAGLGGVGGGGGGFMPFVPGGLGAGGAGGLGGAGATRESRRSASGDGANPFLTGQNDGTRSGGVQGRSVPGAGGMSPVIGGTPAGGTGRNRATVRPGYADRGRSAGVAAGLLGRAAKDADFNAIGAGSAARRPSRRRGADERDDTVKFLDEEAWLTNDPGAGVIRSDEPDSRRGRPQLG